MEILTAQTIMDMLNRNAERFHAFGATRIGLFGSYLNDCATQASDIDLLVSFESPDFDRYMEMKFFLEDLFGRKVDLVIEEDIKPALADVKKTAWYAQAV
jgi:uncharacterized protein